MTTLERLRREQGFDQKDLAARAGVAQSTVSRAESGGKLTAQTALAPARLLKVSGEQLLARSRKARRVAPQPRGAGHVEVNRGGVAGEDLAATGS